MYKCLLFPSGTPSYSGSGPVHSSDSISTVQPAHYHPKAREGRRTHARALGSFTSPRLLLIIITERSETERGQGAVTHTRL